LPVEITALHVDETFAYVVPTREMVRDFQRLEKIAIDLPADYNRGLMNNDRQYRFAGKEILIFAYLLHPAHTPFA
jgi:hypothetical protein